MSDYSYTTVPGKIKQILAKIRTVGIPAKATIQWLKSIGFKSSNDSSLLTVLKFVGFVDASNIPTTVWSNYRGANYKTILGQAVKKDYAELYAVYPDAHKREISDITHVFSTSSNAGQQVISKTVATFRAFVEEAEFSTVDAGHDPIEIQTGPLHKAIATKPKPDPSEQPRPEIHIDIQIHISPEASVDQIEKIFESMARHLYGSKG